MNAYSDPKRESDPHALPDLEVFEIWARTPYDECPRCCDAIEYGDGFVPSFDAHKADHVGFYWQSCSPGCLPDSDPIGPFETEAEALADAREGMED